MGEYSMYLLPVSNIGLILRKVSCNQGFFSGKIHNFSVIPDTLFSIRVGTIHIIPDKFTQEIIRGL